MNLKQLLTLSSMERKAVLGICGITLFIAASIYEIGKRNYWFEAKNTYYTYVTDADGLRIGSVVSISGLRVGDVSALDVDEKNRIVVTLNVRRTVAARLRLDSVASIARTFIIGEKRIDLIPGAESQPVLANGATLPGKDVADLTEFVTGKKLAELMSQIESLIGGLNTVVKDTDQIFGKYRDGSFNKTITMVEPALQNFLKLSSDLIVMTKEVKKKSKELPVLVENGVSVLGDLHQDFFTGKHLAKDSLEKLDQVVTPLAAQQQLIEGLLANLADLSGDLRANPQFGRQAIEALQELTVTLKALQKTWILEDQAAAVKAEQKKNANRQVSPTQIKDEAPAD